MNKIISILLFILICKSSFSQSIPWQWSRSIGSTDFDQANCQAHDSNGNVYVAGAYRGTVDFNPSPTDSFILTSNLYDDIFVCKFDSSGNFLWARGVGSNDDDEVVSVAVDNAGNVYVVGYYFMAIDFDPDSINSFVLTPTGSSSGFIWKLDSSGNFVWAKSLDGTGLVGINCIKLNASNNIFICGTLNGTADLDPSAGTFNLSSASSNVNGFISRMDSAGNLMYAAALSGSFANPKSIALDPSGNIIISGFFKDTMDFDPGSGIYSVIGDSTVDSFVESIDSVLNFNWVRTFNGAGEIWSYAMAVDPMGGIITAGQFTGSIDIDPDSLSTFNITSNGSGDGFILKLDNVGNFLWGGSLGDSGSDNITSIATDASGNVFFCGYFYSTVDLDITGGNHTVSSSGADDIFIEKLTSNGNFVGANVIGGADADEANAVTTDFSGNIYLSGDFRSASMTVDQTLSNAGSVTTDIFFAKLKSCNAGFSVYPDTVPHNWLVVNESFGTPPLTYLWNWGDSTTSTGSSPSHTYSSPGYYNICVSITDNDGCFSTNCDSSTYLFRTSIDMSIISVRVIEQVPVFVPENSESSGISVYPNPTYNGFTISFPHVDNSVDIVLMDMTGREVYRRKSFSETFFLDVSEIKSGLYLLKVTGSNRSETFKVEVRK